MIPPTCCGAFELRLERRLASRPRDGLLPGLGELHQVRIQRLLVLTQKVNEGSRHFGLTRELMQAEMEVMRIGRMKSVMKSEISDGSVASVSESNKAAMGHET